MTRASAGANVQKYYVDSDHGGDQPHTTLSHTGVYLTVNGLPVHWRSNKQPKTANSSTLAEVHAYGEAVRDVNFLQWRMEDIGCKPSWPAILHEDNKAVVAFQNSTTANTKLRGMINMKHAWVQELKNQNLTKAAKIATNENIADLLTKCYQPRELKMMIRRMQVVDKIENIETVLHLGGTCA